MNQKASIIVKENSAVRNQMSGLGIDLGGTKLACAVVNQGKIVSPVSKVETPQGADNIVEAMITLIDEFRDHHLIAGVGIATAGDVNVETGEIIGATGNLPGWLGTPLKKIIERRTMLPVHVENDANAAAYGECCAGGLKDLLCSITVTLGTGIGVGIVINGKLYRGAHWAGGEGGHMPISMNNERLCTCGLWNCWEAYAAGRGLVATAQNLLTGMTESQSSLVAYESKLSTTNIIEAAADQDIVAQKAMKVWHEHISTGLASMAHLLDPNLFLIGGGLSKFVDYQLLKELLRDKTLPHVGSKIDIRPSVLGPWAGLVGAAELAVDVIQSPS